MKKKKILIIDDEKGFASMLMLNLESTGRYEVAVECDSLKALDVALELRPDLILLDVIMPYKEGPDIAYDIKNNPQLSSTPIVFLTATIRQNEIQETDGRIGGHPFIAKPSTLKQIIETIENNISE